MKRVKKDPKEEKCDKTKMIREQKDDKKKSKPIISDAVPFV